MRIVILASSALVALSALPSDAPAALINFDERPNLTLPLSNEYAGLGVVFSAVNGAFTEDILAQGAGYNTSSPRNVAYPAFVNATQDTLVMTFSSPASAVSFYAIDVGDSSRDAVAFDVFNNILQTISVYNPGSGPGIGNINLVSFSVSGIARVEFGQGAFFNAGDGAAIDDLSFEVPAPSAAMALGLATLSISRRRRA